MNEPLPVSGLVEVDFDPFAGSELARAVPTTEAQREVWLADQMGREASLAFNESVSLYISGPLDVPSLERALNALVCRHESLRLTFSSDGLNLLIAATAELPVRFFDLTLQSPREQNEVLSQLRIEAVETPFDLVHGPLIRVILVCKSGQSHELIITAHHVVCDGWAISVVARELMSLYAKEAGVKIEKALAAPESYGDYALAQSDEEHLEALKSDTSWWLEQFQSSIPVLDLPGDRPRPAVRRFDSLREELILDGPLVEAVRKLGASHGSSLFATLFSTFGALLARLSAQEDVIIGVPAAGQAAEGKPGLVGHCVQFLPIRMAVDRNRSFEALLQETRGRVLDAFDHQSCTLGGLLKDLRVERDPSRLPVTSVMFNLDAAIRAEDLSLAGLRVNLRSNPRRFENFELFLNACQNGDEIILECQYNTGLFDKETVARWLLLYRVALQRAVEDSAQSVCEIFSPTSLDIAILDQFNSTSANYPREISVSSLIAQQSCRNPDSIAIESAKGQMDYRTLQNRSNALARLLRSRGMGRGTLIGLCLERGPDMVVAQLAILKSGGAYVPLDPAYPEDRLAYMAQDAGLAMLVTESALENAVPWPREQALFIDADAKSFESESVEDLDPDEVRDARPGDPAYVIYTSGSTGKPKGVIVHHQAVVNFLVSMAREPGLKAGDILVAVTTLSFDIAVLELLLPLSVGAKVVLASRDQALDGQALRKLVETSGAKVMQATPALWRLLIDAGWKGCPDFKALIGGEGLPQDLALQLQARTGELWNMYGPTETTVWSTCWKVMPNPLGISIGKPIANTTIWILDEFRKRCPIGVPGEIYIGGDGVTPGYWNRPELTAEKFVDDPFDLKVTRKWGVLKPRLYRTGDRGRLRNDGLLEHMGRLDFQVKVRGFRIELGEIESNLAGHPAVARAVVLVREDRPGDVRLVAYLVAKPGMEIKDADLRGHLKLTLPDYMIPQHFIVLEKIPLLPNGKLDRKFLPPPGSPANPANDFVAPGSQLEKGIAEEMEAVLGFQGVGLHNDFFSLGGHSLLAAQLIYKVNKRFESALSMRTVFEAPTVARLAQRLAQVIAAPVEPRMSITRLPDQSHFPASLMQERLWQLERIVPGRVVYHAPSAHRLIGPMNEKAFEKAFLEIIRRQSVLRTFFEGHGNEVEQIVKETIPFSLFPAEDLSSDPPMEKEARLNTRLEQLTAETFDLTQAPVFRARMFRLTELEHVLFFMPHHIIWDGWSFDIFYTEMSALYEAFSAGNENPLPELPVSYGDFSVWHRSWTQGAEYERQVKFWRQRMAINGSPQPLPTDKPRRSAMSGEGNTEAVSVNGATTNALHELAGRSGATLFTATLSIYALLLYDYSRQSRLVIGTPVRARNAPELELVMGFFNNLLLLHINIVPEERFIDLLDRIKSLVIECFAYPDAPLEELARELPGMTKDGPPLLYQALFSFQDARQRITHWGELSHSMIPLFQRGATEDLGMWFLESAKGLQGGVTYNADILENSTVQQLRGRYLVLLDAILKTPESTVETLVGSTPTFPQAEAQRVAAEKNLEDESSMSDFIGGKIRYVAPRNDLEISIATVWQRILGVERVGIHDNFFDLGGNSLGVINLSAEVEKATGIAVDVGEVFRSPTIALLVKSMGPNAEKNASVVVPLQSSGNGSPVFCICGVNIYSDFAKSLGNAQPVFGVYVAEEQAIANQAIKGEMPDVSIVRLVEAYYGAIVRFRPKGPYRLAGFSLGGILALELASFMRGKGDEVEVVILLDTFLPHAYRRNWLKWVRFKFKEIFGAVTQRLSYMWKKIISREPVKPIPDGNEATRKEDSGYALLRAIAFESAASKWHPDPVLSEVPIVLFQAADLYLEYPYLDFDKDYGWGQYFGNRFTSISIPGDHLGILRPPNVEILGRKARDCLDKSH